MQLLRQHIGHRDEAAERAVTTARWRVHDELVRGNPSAARHELTSGSAIVAGATQHATALAAGQLGQVGRRDVV